VGDLGEEKNQEGEKRKCEVEATMQKTVGGENPSVATIYNFVQM